MTFHDEQTPTKTKTISVIPTNSVSAVGQIQWSYQFRTYVFVAKANSILTAHELMEVSQEIRKITQEANNPHKCPNCDMDCKCTEATCTHCLENIY